MNCAGRRDAFHLYIHKSQIKQLNNSRKIIFLHHLNVYDIESYY